jgi:hypothetical protein
MICLFAKCPGCGGSSGGVDCTDRSESLMRLRPPVLTLHSACAKKAKRLAAPKELRQISHCGRATFDTDNIDIGPERRNYLDHRLSRVWEMNSEVGALDSALSLQHKSA